MTFFVKMKNNVLTSGFMRCASKVCWITLLVVCLVSSFRSSAGGIYFAVGLYKGTNTWGMCAVPFTDPDQIAKMRQLANSTNTDIASIEATILPGADGLNMDYGIT